KPCPDTGKHFLDDSGSLTRHHHPKPCSDDIRDSTLVVREDGTYRQQVQLKRSDSGTIETGHVDIHTQNRVEPKFRVYRRQSPWSPSWLPRQASCRCPLIFLFCPAT